MSLPRHFIAPSSHPGPSSSVVPAPRKDLPAYGGLKTYFECLEDALDLRDLPDGKWVPRVGVSLYGPLAVHLYTGEHPTGELHAHLAYPIVVPDGFSFTVPSPGGPLTIRRVIQPETRTLRWPSGDYSGPEVDLGLGVPSFGVRLMDPVDLAVSMCTELSATDAACIESLIAAQLITWSNFNLLWAASFSGDDGPSERDLAIRAQVFAMFEHWSAANQVTSS